MEEKKTKVSKSFSLGIDLVEWIEKQVRASKGKYSSSDIVSNALMDAIKGEDRKKAAKKQAATETPQEEA